MGNYRLSEAAKADFARIYRRGLVEHGEAQADRYFHAFLNASSNLQNSRFCIQP